MKKVLIAIGKALGFALIFIIAQSLVLFAASIVYTFRVAMQSFVPFGTVQPYEELLHATMSFIERYGTLLVALGDILALFAARAIYRLRNKRLSAEVCLTSASPRDILCSAACGALFAVTVCVALAILPIPETLLQAYSEASSEVLSVNTPLMLLSIIFIGPFTEEIYFRGLAYTRLKRGMPYWSAILVTSLIFGVIHSDVLWLAYAFCASVFMCCVMEKSGSLWCSVAFHCAFNFAGTYVVEFIPDMPLLSASMVCLAAAALGFFFLKCVGGKLPGLREKNCEEMEKNGDDGMDAT